MKVFFWGMGAGMVFAGLLNLLLPFPERPNVELSENYYMVCESGDWYFAAGVLIRQLRSEGNPECTFEPRASYPRAAWRTAAILLGAWMRARNVLRSEENPEPTFEPRASPQSSRRRRGSEAIGASPKNASTCASTSRMSLR